MRIITGILDFSFEHDESLDVTVEAESLLARMVIPGVSLVITELSLDNQSYLRISGGMVSTRRLSDVRVVNVKAELKKERICKCGQK